MMMGGGGEANPEMKKVRRRKRVSGSKEDLILTELTGLPGFSLILTGWMCTRVETGVRGRKSENGNERALEQASICFEPRALGL